MNKQTIILTLFFLLFCTAANFAQTDYTVIKISGNILLKVSGKSLAQGTVFSEKEELLFKTMDSRAAVINPTKGRFILTSSNKGSTAKSNLLPAMSNASSRAGSVLNITDLQNFFSGNFLIINNAGIRISPQTFPMDTVNFFFIRYTYQGESINKKLRYNGDTLFIERSSLFTVDGKPIPNPEVSEMKMYYRQGDKSLLICDFTPVFPDEAALESEVKILLENLKDKPAAEKIDQVTSFLNEFYGKPDKDNVAIWLKKNFGVSM